MDENRLGENIGALGTPRDRLFQALYYRAAYIYHITVAVSVRRCIEFIVLLMAILLFGLVTYVHIVFTRQQPSCLESVRHLWPRNGILNVHITSGLSKVLLVNYNPDTYQSPDESMLHNNSSTFSYEFSNSPSLSVFRPSLYWSKEHPADVSTKPPEEVELYMPVSSSEVNNNHHHNYGDDSISEEFWLYPQEVENNEEEPSAIEYAVEYGFLRLSSATRDRLKIPIMYVALNPYQEVCFGESFNRFLLDHFFGYDFLLISSVKSLASNESEKGYMRNLVTGEQYRFVTMWMSRSSYISALLTMLTFTFSISALLRFSHQQFFVFIINVFQLFELNAAFVQVAPLISVILGLVGMEAVMSEFFNDTNIAFCVILMIWFADQYDFICCTSPLSRRYWPRFFYLYHFVFYAYYSRFNGQFCGLVLLTTWALTLHSMLYFFHHYELPRIVQRLRVRTVVATVETNPRLFSRIRNPTRFTFRSARNTNFLRARLTVRTGEPSDSSSQSSTTSTFSSELSSQSSAATLTSDSSSQSFTTAAAATTTTTTTTTTPTTLTNATDSLSIRI
ncbi:Membralin [Trichinella britovi]|uniref:Membralin n=1 Tax=Trichinella britovi TaxID=45882 RepID=A0A0V1CH56_TRIBR|nr:Membralin [Trichinella britovi]